MSGARVLIPAAMLAKAAALGEQQKRDGRYKAADSIRHGDGCRIGALGVLVALSLFPDATDVSAVSYHYDIRLRDGRVLEVKTKERAVDPEPNFHATVAAANFRQRADAYLFVSITAQEQPRGWVNGWMPVTEFRSHPRLYFGKAGTIEPGSQPPFRFKADCYNLRVDLLRPISDLAGAPRLRCPVCGSRLHVVTLDTTVLRYCEGPCTGRAIASALGAEL